MRFFLFTIGSILLASYACAATPVETIQFRDGTKFFVSRIEGSSGTSLAEAYLVERAADKKPACIKTVAEGTQTPILSDDGILSCFDMAYIEQSDLIWCNSKGQGGQSWHVHYYAAANNGLVLERSSEVFADDEKETIILYERKH